MPPLSDMTVAVFGTGSIGRRHLANLAKLGVKTTLCSRRADRSIELDDGRTIRATTDKERAIRDADAVVIATPTDEHVAIACLAAKAGKALYIEKPLSHDREGIPELQTLARELVVEVGCQLRSHPGLQFLKRRMDSGDDGRLFTFSACVGQRLDTWRPGTDYRESYSAKSSRGGGALFDLVHEVDLVHWLCGAAAGVFARLSQVSNLKIEAEDLANLTIELRSGACGSVQLDMVSPVYRRALTIVCEHANYEWDYTAATLLRRSLGGIEVIYKATGTFERNDLFLDHMQHFLSRVHDPSVAPRCSFADGVACLDILLAARRSSESDRWIPV